MKPQRASKTGSRYLYEPFTPPDHRVALLECLLEEKTTIIKERLDKIDAQISQLDRRMWIACFGVVMVLLTEAIIGILTYA